MRRPVIPSALLLFLLGSAGAPADTYPRQPGIDILHYRFELEISDRSDEISGLALVDLRLLEDGVGEVALDLVGADTAAPGHGMEVSRVSWQGATQGASYSHASGTLRVAVPAPAVAGERRQLLVEYRGVPETGLVIADNKHGERCFFSDNWPDKARHWLPMIDHPYDKATADMIVTAPAHYQVVSNGRLVEETDLDGERRRTHWRQSVPIASWLYALGAARFAVDHREPFRGLPIQTWVFAADRDAGFDDFAEPTRHVLEFFSDFIGPYPYEKLANVQSNSVSGGMESASAIFYDDDSVTGERSERWRAVVTHEIAHQWWGNSVTEADWDDVWLSEGFATYFTLLFVEHDRGHDAMIEGLLASRDRVFAFQAEHPDYRLVHDNLDDMARVLTGHIYQKGAWVLHMLRGLIGDESFQQGIRDYYRLYRDGSARTADFRRVMEEASGRSLDWFFDQWLYRGGGLEVDGAWSWASGALTLDLRQTQTGETFRMPIEVEVVAHDGSATRHSIELERSSQRFAWPVDRKPQAVRLDPDLQVLMRATLEPR